MEEEKKTVAAQQKENMSYNIEDIDDIFNLLQAKMDLKTGEDIHLNEQKAT